MAKPAKNTICLWYDGGAEEAARFYAKTFPDSSVDAVHLAPGDFPSGKKGSVLTVEFSVMGIPCLGLNGGPAFQHNEAFSFQVATCRIGAPVLGQRATPPEDFYNETLELAPPMYMTDPTTGVSVNVFPGLTITLPWEAESSADRRTMINREISSGLHCLTGRRGTDEVAFRAANSRALAPERSRLWTLVALLWRFLLASGCCRQHVPAHQGARHGRPCSRQLTRASGPVSGLCQCAVWHDQGEFRRDRKSASCWAACRAESDFQYAI